jgi:hypothetical protein
LDDVLFILDTRPPGPPQKVLLPWVDANEIRGRAVEHSGAAQELHRNLERVRTPDSDSVILGIEAIRLELLSILDAIETGHPPLSAALVGLRKAASSPIIGG